MIDGNLKSIINIGLDKPFFNLDKNKNEPLNSKTVDTNSDTLAGLQSVADQFEAIFLETLLRQARESKLSNGLFDSKADDNFEQMFDQELANSSSKLVDIGIADAIVRQMSKTRI
jgi:Rod binding domain-containing protein